MKISNALKMKIVESDIESVSVNHFRHEIDNITGHTISFPSHKEIKLFLNLNNDLNLLKECKKWIELICYCCKEIKIDIGYFIGLYPVEIDINNGVVIFTADAFDYNNLSWKDWFVMEE